MGFRRPTDNCEVAGFLNDITSVGGSNVAVLFGKVDFHRLEPKCIDVEEGLGGEDMARCT